MADRGLAARTVDDHERRIVAHDHRQLATLAKYFQRVATRWAMVATSSTRWISSKSWTSAS